MKQFHQIATSLSLLAMTISFNHSLWSTWLLTPEYYLELLRFEQRVCQIHKQPQTNDPAYDVLPIHYSIPHQSRSQALTYQNDNAKKTTTNPIKMKSSISLTPQYLNKLKLD